MAYPQTLSHPVHALHHDLATSAGLPPHHHHHHHHHNHHPHHRHTSKQRFVADLSQCLFDFVIQLLPPSEELQIKEDVRKLLERLIRTIEPDSRLLAFGSTANGFSLRNSDMDLCSLIDSGERLAASDLVTMLGDLLERETKFHVKTLPHARIPIVKLSLDPSPGLPFGIACDIGFENRLAIENTRLLYSYAKIDPTRVRTLVLFLKIWSKRRKINSPYKGTLSSYGYVLLVIYFLVHVKNPPVLPNLQQMPPLRPINKEETTLNGYNVWFFDDIDILCQRWQSENTETVAELLIDFFRYFSRDFSYNTGVASIRAGLLKKESKGWQNDLSSGRYNDARERNRFCIEDPFEIDYNVARCVTKDGLYTIRGEFMRASRILATRPERAVVALAELCEERKEEDLVAAPSHGPRMSLPPQTPYTIGSQSLRPKGAAAQERLSPPTQFFESGPRIELQHIPSQQLPEHMAPKRAKWTSPPPLEAPPVDHSLYESQLDKSLELATAPTDARERETNYNSSETGSEGFTDEDRSDAAESDIGSVKSFTEGTTFLNNGAPIRRPSWYINDNLSRQWYPTTPDFVANTSYRLVGGPRGRFPRQPDGLEPSSPTSYRSSSNSASSSPKSEYARRSLSGPSRSLRSQNWLTGSTTPLTAPLPPSPESPLDSHFSDPSTVYYQTTVTRSPRPTVLYPGPGTHSSLLSQYQTYTLSQQQVSHDVLPQNLPPMNPRSVVGLMDATARGLVGSGPETPTPTMYGHGHGQHGHGRPPSHSHSLSSGTIVALTPPPHASQFVLQGQGQGVGSGSPLASPHAPSDQGRDDDQSRERSRSSSPPLPPPPPPPPPPSHSASHQQILMAKPKAFSAAVSVSKQNGDHATGGGGANSVGNGSVIQEGDDMSGPKPLTSVSNGSSPVPSDASASGSERLEVYDVYGLVSASTSASSVSRSPSLRSLSPPATAVPGVDAKEQQLQSHEGVSGGEEKVGEEVFAEGRLLPTALASLKVREHTTGLSITSEEEERFHATAGGVANVGAAVDGGMVDEREKEEERVASDGLGVGLGSTGESS